MKKTLYILLTLLWFISSYAHASEHAVQLEQKIFSRILHGIVGHGNSVRVYYYGKSPPPGLRNNPDIRLTGSPSSAEVIVIDHKPFSRRLARLDKPALTLDYDLLKRYPNAVGAYFWQKGRPNIVMIRSRLLKAGITLPAEFDRYIDNTIW